MKRKWNVYLILLSVMTLILGGCSENMKVSAEEIIHQVIESEKEITDYRGTAEMKLFEGDELIEHAILEEYAEGNKRKISQTDQLLNNETITVNDGEKLFIYDKGNKEAFEMDISEMGEVPGNSPKEQFTSMIDMMKDSHSIELVGEEEMVGFDTYHIRLSANETDSLLGDMEVWVDQDTWFVVKIISESGDSRSEFTYTELDVAPEFKEETFQIDIPNDVEIKNLKEEFGANAVTTEEAIEALEQDFLVFNEENLELVDIQMHDFSEQLERYEVELTYHSKDSIPMFILSIFPTPEDMKIESSSLEIRENPAEYDEVINSYLWDEDGLRYSLIIMNPDLEREEIIEWTEAMIFSSEHE